MEKVRVKKEELLETLKENRTAHRDLFERACDAYRAEAIKQLDAALADARASKRVIMSFSMVEPVDQTKEYDQAIRMLEMSVDDVIELTDEAFKCYVMDDWSWSGHARTSNTAYLMKS